jgi:hypothetical protein
VVYTFGPFRKMVDMWVNVRMGEWYHRVTLVTSGKARTCLREYSGGNLSEGLARNLLR